MVRSRQVDRLLVLAALLAGIGSCLGISSPVVLGQEPLPATSPGQFFVIEEPINSDVLERVKVATREVIARASTRKSERPVLVFEFRAGQAQPGSSGFGVSLELANYLSTELAGAKYTVAYIPEPLKGFAVLPALACGEIVMGPNASLGPITPDGQEPKADYRDPVRLLARRFGRDSELFVGMLDPRADLKVVKTADQQSHYILAENLPAFVRDNPVDEASIQPAWEGGSRGQLTARKARDTGFVKRLVDNVAEIANLYHVDAQAVANDPTLLSEPRPVWIQVQGQIDPVKEGYLRRRIDQARRDGINLVFFQINSIGGLNTSVDNIATLIAELRDMKTVAYIDEQAMGVSALIPLACDDIVFRKSGQMGQAGQILVGRNRQAKSLTPSQVKSLAERASNIASKKGHSPSIARAMVDKEVKLLRVTDSKTGSSVAVLDSEIKAEPDRYLDASTIKDVGTTLNIRSDEAASLGLGREVDNVEELKGLYGLQGKAIRIDGPTWVDGLVTTLNDPFIGWMLLFVGVFMLILEIKMPGVGLPAIASALAFLLFFWSRYLSGTADQLEILLFLVGLVCLGLELFVFPGFGVFGLSGLVLIIASIVMASHTFVWPTQDYEYRQMANTLLQVVGVMVGVSVAAAVVGRYLPSLPFLNRMVLKPQGETGSGLDLDDPLLKPPPLEGYESFAFLMGETGRTTTVLKPSGKARFGSLLIDVRADGSFIERDTLIEVIDVQGLRVVVKPVMI